MKAPIKALSAALALFAAQQTLANANYFNRVANFFVCLQSQSCDDDKQTAAEIVYSDKQGKTLVYTDSPAHKLGFVDISDLNKPQAKHAIKLDGEPTSVVIKDRLALVVMNTSKDYINTQGQLAVQHLDTFEKLATFELNGQPDSIAISPDGRFAAIAIENERDEKLNKGQMPQLPAGFLVIVDTDDNNPKNWRLRQVNLTGLSGVYPEDSEPEYVSINQNNIAAVTLQENNAIVLIDLATGNIINHFSAGVVNLSQIDTSEDKPFKISLTGQLTNIAREPDGIVWLDNEHFATANEGDYQGGSRSFSIFNIKGELVYDSGNELEHLAVKFGHYPKKRAAKKGVEPENVAVGVFNGEKLLFINAERANLVFVYHVDNPQKPRFKQILPTGVAPEGAFVIPSRNALVVAAEKDAKDDKIRSVISIYQYGDKVANYPTLQSANKDGLPIAWSALSGLAASNEPHLLYSIEDGFFGKNRIFVIDTSTKPAQIIDTISIQDTQGVLANFMANKTFVHADKMVNADKTVNLDIEGIANDNAGNFYLAVEGAGSVNDNKRPISSPNFILKLNKQGEILQVIGLPEFLNAMQLRFGLEGIAVDNNKIYVALQRAWGDEKHARIGIYDLKNSSWQFVFYPLEQPSQAKSANVWVGISELSLQGDGIFWVLERDNQAGIDAQIKRIYQIDLSDDKLKPNSVLNKTLVRDILPDLSQASQGLIPEKIEGLATIKDGKTFIVNDNDGVDDNNGETQLIQLMPTIN